MKVSLFVASTPHPIGGSTAIFEFADGLARRDHEVHIAHAEFGLGITDAEDIWWHTFNPKVTHHYATDPPPADAVLLFDGNLRSDLGRPFMWIQARFILPNEESIYNAHCPKLCTSTWLQEVALQEGVGPAHHVPCGLHHQKWQPGEPWHDREPVVAMLYNSHPLKGGSIGLDALELVRSERPEVSTIAFGTSPDPERANIEYHRNPPQEQIVNLFGRTRVFVQSALREGFGLSCIEAMACGAALVTTDCGGSRDYATASSAYIVPPGDPEDLAEAVLTALDHGGAKVSEGQRVAATFDWDVSAAILEGIISR